MCVSECLSNMSFFDYYTTNFMTQFRLELPTSRPEVHGANHYTTCFLGIILGYLLFIGMCEKLRHFRRDLEPVLSPTMSMPLNS